MIKREAEKLTARISSKLETIANGYEAIMPMIKEAYEGRAWEALSYDDWDSYVQDRFGDRLLRIDTALRQSIVRELTASGLSTRAIAPVAGVSKSTVAVVQKEIAESEDNSGVRGGTPEVKTKTIKGRDGKEYTFPVKTITMQGEEVEVPVNYNPMPTPADRDRRRETVARLYKEGYHLADIAEAMEISSSTITSDLHAQDLGGKRPHGTTLERGSLTDRIDWHVPYDADDWRTQYAGMNPRQWCQIHNPRRDKLIKEINERLYILDGYNPLEKGFQDQLSRVAERCAEIISHYDKAGNRTASQDRRIAPPEDLEAKS